MVRPDRGFGKFRRQHRIKRNRQTIELIDESGEVQCSVEDAWNESVSRSTGAGVIQTHNLSQTWKLPAANVPAEVVPGTEWILREKGDGTRWRVLSVQLKTNNLTWWLVCEHMRDHSLKSKRPT